MTAGESLPYLYVSIRITAKGYLTSCTDIIGNFLHKKQIWREQIQHKTDTAVSDKPSPIWSFAGSFFRCFSVKSTHPNHPTIMYPPNLPIIDPTNFGDAFHRHKPEQQGIIQICAQRWPPLEANHKLLQNVHRRQFFFVDDDSVQMFFERYKKRNKYVSPLPTVDGKRYSERCS